MSGNQGGYIRGPWWRYRQSDDQNTRRCFVIAWGQIVKEPIDQFKKDLRSIQFVIKTGRGADRNEKHLVCIGYGETTASVVMRAMDKGDMVFVTGTWVEMKYRNKKGDAVKYEMRVSFIIPFGLIGFLLELYGTESVQRAVEEHRNEDADVWESD